MKLAEAAGNQESGILQRRQYPMKQGHSASWLGRMSRPLIWTVEGGIFAFAGITAFLLRSSSVSREKRPFKSHMLCRCGLP